MKRRVPVLLTVALTLALVLAACGGGAAGGGSLKVGVVANQTTDYALAGQFLLNGLQMAVEELNAAGGVKGKKIEVSVADAAKDNTTAVNAASKIFSEKPNVVFLPIYSTQVMAIQPELKKSPFVSFTAASNVAITQQGMNYIFRSRPHDGTIAAAAVFAAVEKLNKKKLGLIHVNNEYGNGGAKVMAETAKAAGATVVGDEAYGPTDKDFRPQLKKLSDAGAEVMILWGHPGDSGLVIKQRKELGLKADLLSGVTIVSPAVIDLVTAEEMNGVYAVIDAVAVPLKNPNAEIKVWAEKYKEKYKADPDYSAFSYYNTMKLAAKALEAGTDFETLRKAVAGIDFTGLGGIRYQYDQVNDVIQDVALVQFTGKAPGVKDAKVRSR